jgi:hypothetical protein
LPCRQQIYFCTGLVEPCWRRFKNYLQVQRLPHCVALNPQLLHDRRSGFGDVARKTDRAAQENGGLHLDRGWHSVISFTRRDTAKENSGTRDDSLIDSSSRKAPGPNSSEGPACAGLNHSGRRGVHGPDTV